MNTNHAIQAIQQLTHLDPNYIKMGAAALVFGLIMASARNFIGKANATFVGAVLAWTFYTHNTQYVFFVIAYGAISAMFLLAATRRARA